MQDIRRIIQNVRVVSSLPSIFTKVNEVINDPSSCAADLGAIIEKDQVLTSRLLQLANSAFYGFPGKIDTITWAVKIIGFKQLKDLVLAISIRSNFAGVGKSVHFDMAKFWEHSIACGIASRVLAIYNGAKNAEAHFVAGFLHDFGRLVLLEQYPQKYEEVSQRVEGQNQLVEEAEKEIFGFTHTEVGGELIKSWNLPDSLSEAVAYHHCPLKAQDFAELTAVVHIANVIVHSCEYGDSGDSLVPPLEPETWQMVGLKSTMLEPVLREIRTQYDDSIDFLLIQ